MSAAEITKLQESINAAKFDLGKLGMEQESCRHLHIVERLVGIVETLSARVFELEHKQRKTEPDHK